jgi:hypothetical protein
MENYKQTVSEEKVGFYLNAGINIQQKYLL